MTDNNHEQPVIGQARPVYYSETLQSSQKPVDVVASINRECSNLSGAFTKLKDDVGTAMDQIIAKCALERVWYYKPSGTMMYGEEKPWICAGKEEPKDQPRREQRLDPAAEAVAKRAQEMKDGQHKFDGDKFLDWRDYATDVHHINGTPKDLAKMLGELVTLSDKVAAFVQELYTPEESRPGHDFYRDWKGGGAAAYESSRQHQMEAAKFSYEATWNLINGVAELLHSVSGRIHDLALEGAAIRSAATGLVQEITATASNPMEWSRLVDGAFKTIDAAHKKKVDQITNLVTHINDNVANLLKMKRVDQEIEMNSWPKLAPNKVNPEPVKGQTDPWWNDDPVKK